MRDSVIGDRLERWAMPVDVHEQLLAGATAAEIETELERFGARRCFFLDASVGALFGVELADGSLVAMKLHQATVERSSLELVQRAQARLVEEAFPCPRPVLPPTPFLGRLLTGEEWRTDGAPAERIDSARRCAMAALLARQVEVCAELVGDRRPDQREALWPVPHNALFDFARPGADWIDEIAARAWSSHGAGPIVLGHHDWTSKHLRWDGNEVVVVYDWDSLSIAHESTTLGWNAAMHTHPAEHRMAWVPAVEDAVAFVDAYAQARTVDEDTRRAAEHEIVYAVAYAARCEHGFVAGTPATDARSVLREFAERLL